MSAVEPAAERAVPPKDLEIRPKQAKAWMDALPVAQPLDAARKLAAYLATGLAGGLVDMAMRPGSALPI